MPLINLKLSGFWLTERSLQTEAYHFVVSNSVRIRKVLVENSVETLGFSVAVEREENSSHRLCISSVLMRFVLAAAFRTTRACSFFPTANSHLGDSGMSLLKQTL